ncbi:aminotransferase class I/II-fold pyridoxal phosphate-dependent enzyme [Mucilaginibacter gotjawali]|uniref:8-amino-7-oxononanoate synthase/2-amino-3-ketobutyrate coenzyme A ligase n=2 Tax=Mucilaginibacter gotjawali TaxID=1550579 RepID=A0A0X8X907_9SPHI|nr:aminotransferase class I/II-fold pyridoxal phosphate-dependent enzyme [Mucilaginibacter gotjawali]MBB3058282.1 glycine C-acetyltransferase [Mucilaginibacter gotjawali]BAU55599.1 8-amino-7-oxononanoate synthase/2-amino-3-ketobutyrate coenzyme A ligase [Mucilaginibacter gotjawali]
MEIDFEKASFKDFENIKDYDMYARAAIFNKYLNFLDNKGHLNYRMESISGCGPEMDILIPGKSKHETLVGLVSNDYLGFTQHPKVKEAVVGAIRKYGTGAGASPAIGGHFSYHEKLEKKIASFFRRDNAILYTTGYTANSATFQSLLQKEDIAILDMAVHASVYEGCQLTNIKTFLHNNLELLERALGDAKDKYRNKMVIIDGVYSQDGDLAPLDKILELTKHYGAYLAIDDAHGTGVIGKTGRGVLELYDLFGEVDLITGTFSKTFASAGGYVVARPELIRFLKFQSRQHLFSATSTPAVAGIIKAIELVDEEPHWMDKLWQNVNYFKQGLIDIGMDVGNTASAIIPVKIGDPKKSGEAGRLLLEQGIYTNPIIYPAVAKKNARIRMSLMATHTKAQLDKTLNAFEYVDHKIGISKT